MLWERDQNDGECRKLLDRMAGRFAEQLISSEQACETLRDRGCDQLAIGEFTPAACMGRLRHNAQLAQEPNQWLGHIDVKQPHPADREVQTRAS